MYGSAGMLAGLAAGMLAGLFLPAGAVRAIEPAGLLWFNGLRMTVIPIVMAQLILGLNSQREGGALRALGLRAFGWFAALLTGTAVFSAVLTPLLVRLLPPLQPVSGGTAPGPVPGFGVWVASLLPANVVQTAAENNLLALIFFSLLFGAAVRGVEPVRRETLLAVVSAVNDAMLTIVAWMMCLAPLGVGALAVTLSAKLGSSAAGAFGYYIAFFCGIEIVLTVVLYPLIMLRSRIPIRKWASAVAPVQTLAFSSRSSMAALPAMVAAAEKQMGLSPAVTGFVLPLAVSVFRYSTPVAHVTGAIFIAYLFGIPLTAVQTVLMVATAVFLSFSSPGIPSGGLLVALPLFQQLGLPPEGLGLLVAADAIPDMFKTMANVTAHMAVAAVLDREAA